jgi:2-oxo-3-hexenedioate decarboxylase
MTVIEREELAARLDRAALCAAAIARLTDEVAIDPAAAYGVQEALLARRLARGERLVGLKMGLTSLAKMEQMGVAEVIWGRLTDAMSIVDGGCVDPAAYIHPRVEPEVAFLIDREPEPGREFAAVSAVAPAIELIDSRYQGFAFSLPDVIADNSSAAGFVIGAWQPVPAGLADLAVVLEVDGDVVRTGSTAAILGDPRRALVEGVRLAGEHGVRLREGWVFLAGAATAAVPLRPGARVRAEVAGIGSVSVHAGGTP